MGPRRWVTGETVFHPEDWQSPHSTGPLGQSSVILKWFQKSSLELEGNGRFNYENIFKFYNLYYIFDWWNTMKHLSVDCKLQELRVS